jgi:hypothetical protein
MNIELQDILIQIILMKLSLGLFYFIDLKLISLIYEIIIFLFLSDKCNGVLIQTKPFFEDNKYPFLIIAQTDNGLNCDLHEIPYTIMIGDKNYFLIGITLYRKQRPKHFVLRLFDGTNFYDFDNCKSLNGLMDNSTPEGYELSFAFYQRTKIE